MRQYRLRGAMALVAIVALSLVLGGYLERARQRAAGAGKGASPKAAPPGSPIPAGGKAFISHVGAFW
jgi:hypothetical protein